MARCTRCRKVNAKICDDCFRLALELNEDPPWRVCFGWVFVGIVIGFTAALGAVQGCVMTQIR